MSAHCKKQTHQLQSSPSVMLKIYREIGLPSEKKKTHGEWCVLAAFGNVNKDFGNPAEKRNVPWQNKLPIFIRKDKKWTAMSQTVTFIYVQVKTWTWCSKLLQILETSTWTIGPGEQWRPPLATDCRCTPRFVPSQQCKEKNNQLQQEIKTI